MIKDIAGILLVMVIALGLVAGVVFLTERGDQKRCESLMDTIPYKTHYRAGSCFIELSPELWVEEDGILHALPLLIEEAAQ